MSRKKKLVTTSNSLVQLIPNAWSRHPGNGHPYISTQSGTIVLIVSIDPIIDLNPFSYKVSTKNYFCFQKKTKHMYRFEFRETRFFLKQLVSINLLSICG